MGGSIKIDDWLEHESSVSTTGLCDNDPNTDMIHHLPFRLISVDQHLAEAKGISDGLELVEDKATEEVSTRLHQQNISNDEWKALNKLHCLLLGDYSDLFQCTGCPTATPEIQTYANGAHGRLWYNSFSYLKLLAKHLPKSQEFLVVFFRNTLLMAQEAFEEFPAFRTAWTWFLRELTIFWLWLGLDGNGTLQINAEAWGTGRNYWEAESSLKAERHLGFRL